jgi:serine protease Do
MSKRFLLVLVVALLLPLLVAVGFNAPTLYAQTAAGPASADTPSVAITSTQTAAGALADTATPTPTGMITPTATITATSAVTSTGAVTTTGAVTGTTTLSTTARGPVAPAEALAAFQGTLEDIYNAVSPSVVNIQVAVPASAGMFMTPPDATPMAPDATPMPRGGTPGPNNQFMQQAEGSGFVWDTQGHIITNDHVIDGASRVSVTFSDGTTVTATVVGRDVNSDLAVLLVNAPASLLHPVQLGSSSNLKVGQFVVAIGSPFGFQGTMTTGIISGLSRSLPVGSNTNGPTYSIPDVIQTDASINPGNSGGVLTDVTGRVIGVTSAIESPVRASSGVGFAVPADIVQKVAPALIANGKYTWPYLGISGLSLVPELAQAMSLTVGQRGALVADVAPGGPADMAGIHGSNKTVLIDGLRAQVGGDVITAINATPIRSFDDIIAYLARSTQVSQTVTLSIIRDTQPMTVPVTLGARPAQVTGSETPQATPGAAVTPEATPAATAEATQQATPEGTAQATPGTANRPRLGVLVIGVTPDIAKAMNLTATQQGVLIERVEQGSAADKAGLRGSFKTISINGADVLVGGDIITGLNGQNVGTTNDLQTALAQVTAGSDAKLTILRDGQSMQVTVSFGGSAQ